MAIKWSPGCKCCDLSITIGYENYWGPLYTGFDYTVINQLYANNVTLLRINLHKCDVVFCGEYDRWGIGGATFPDTHLDILGDWIYDGGKAIFLGRSQNTFDNDPDNYPPGAKNELHSKLARLGSSMTLGSDTCGIPSSPRVVYLSSSINPSVDFIDGINTYHEHTNSVNNGTWLAKTGNDDCDDLVWLAMEKIGSGVIFLVGERPFLLNENGPLLYKIIKTNINDM